MECFRVNNKINLRAVVGRDLYDQREYKNAHKKFGFGYSDWQLAKNASETSATRNNIVYIFRKESEDKNSEDKTFDNLICHDQFKYYICNNCSIQIQCSVVSHLNEENKLFCGGIDWSNPDPEKITTNESFIKERLFNLGIQSLE